MPTIVVKKIGSDPSDDYATLQAWYNDRKGDLVSRDTIEVAELRGEVHTLNSALTMSYWENTTDSSHYFVVRAASGAEFKGNFGDLTGVAVLRGASGYFSYYLIDCSVSYTRFENFAIANFNPIYSIYVLNLGGNYTLAKNVGIGNISISGYNLVAFNFSSYTSQAINCVAADLTSTAYIYSTATGFGEGYGGEAYNCTAHRITGYSYAYGFNYVLAKNCVATEVSASYGGCFGYCLSGSDYNASSDNSAPGSNSIKNISASDQFVNTAQGEFNCHLKANADLVDAGTNLSSIFNTDIDGESRPFGSGWDIGADEYVADIIELLKLALRIDLKLSELQTGDDITFEASYIVGGDKGLDFIDDVNVEPSLILMGSEVIHDSPVSVDFIYVDGRVLPIDFVLEPITQEVGLILLAPAIFDHADVALDVQNIPVILNAPLAALSTVLELDKVDLEYLPGIPEATLGSLIEIDKFSFESALFDWLLIDDSFAVPELTYPLAVVSLPDLYDASTLRIPYSLSEYELEAIEAILSTHMRLIATSLNLSIPPGEIINDIHVSFGKLGIKSYPKLLISDGTSTSLAKVSNRIRLRNPRMHDASTLQLLIENLQIVNVTPATRRKYVYSLLNSLIKALQTSAGDLIIMESPIEETVSLTSAIEED